MIERRRTIARGSHGLLAKYSEIWSTIVRPTASTVADIANQSANPIAERAMPADGSVVAATAIAEPTPPSRGPRYRDTIRATVDHDSFT